MKIRELHSRLAIAMQQDPELANYDLFHYRYDDRIPSLPDLVTALEQKNSIIEELRAELAKLKEAE